MGRITSSLLVAVLLVVCNGTLQAQQTDSIVFREYQEEMTLFEDLLFGRSMTDLYFIPAADHPLSITILASDGGKERLSKGANSDRYNISYLDEPTLVINYRQALYQMDVEMIRVHNPDGGEINWMMIPQIKISLR